MNIAMLVDGQKEPEGYAIDAKTKITINDRTIIDFDDYKRAIVPPGKHHMASWPKSLADSSRYTRKE